MYSTDKFATSLQFDAESTLLEWPISHCTSGNYQKTAYKLKRAHKVVDTWCLTVSQFVQKYRSALYRERLLDSDSPYFTRHLNLSFCTTLLPSSFGWLYQHCNVFILQVFTQDGKFLSKFGSRGSGPGQLKGPCGLALDSQDRLIVADRDNHRIQIFDSEGQPIANFGSYGDADGKFSCPRHVAVTQQDEILVSDAGNFRVQMFDKNGAFLFKFGGKGSNKGQFGCPAGIAMDSEEHIAVADLKNVNLQIFDSKGNFVKRVGEQECVKKGSAVFNKPTGLAISANGNVVVADRGNHRVQVFWMRGNLWFHQWRSPTGIQVETGKRESLVWTQKTSFIVKCSDSSKRYTVCMSVQHPVPNLTYLEIVVTQVGSI